MLSKRKKKKKKKSKCKEMCWCTKFSKCYKTSKLDRRGHIFCFINWNMQHLCHKQIVQKIPMF